MREIKFRAWDNVKFKMYYVGESEEVAFAFEGNGITATDITEHDWNFKKLEHLQYMQFTGLHDKNGKEIYEGDIVSFEDAYYSTSENGQEFEVFQNKGVIEYCSEELRYYVTNKQSIDDEQIFGEEIEVIGNIFENPELLEQTE